MKKTKHKLNDYINIKNTINVEVLKKEIYDEGNALIASFIGLRKDCTPNSDDCWYVDTRNYFSFMNNQPELLFHSSYEWLIPVVKEIVAGVQGKQYQIDYQLMKESAADKLFHLHVWVDIRHIFMLTCNWIIWYEENREDKKVKA